MSGKSTPDLAIEAHEAVSAKKDEVNGISVEHENANDGITITRVIVKDKNGERNIGKPVGRYITIEMPPEFYGQQTVYEKMCKICADELKSMVDKIISKNDTVLAVGLGNSSITADSLGPKVISSLMITRHLKEYIPKEIDESIRPVCAISPGVLGTTGIETEEIVKSIAEKIKPKLVIVIDALCSGNIKRINSTIQLTDTGITPGGGVGNKRKTINKNTLDIPVIAIGVPTVVDAATIANEGVNFVLNKDTSDEHDEISAALNERFGNLIVTPKDVESATDNIASVIANGINISLHKGITLSDIDRYV